MPEVALNHSAMVTRPSQLGIIIPNFPVEETEMERVKKMQLSLSGLQVVPTPFPSVDKKVAFLLILEGEVWPRDLRRSMRHGQKCHRVPPRSCPLCWWNTGQSGPFVTADPWAALLDSITLLDQHRHTDNGKFYSSKLLRFWLRMEKVFATMIRQWVPYH